MRGKPSAATYALVCGV